MEQNFQTSFIPKKPMVQGGATASRPVGFLTIISIFIFLTVLLSFGGLYFYKGYLAKNITQKEKDLKIADKQFEVAQITQMQILDKRLRASNEILSQHIVISPIFKVLSEITLKNVRYTNFTYQLSTDKDSKVSVKLKGVAVGYRDVASQSDLFNVNKNFIDPVFSNLALNEKGNVLFDLDFYVDRNFVDYKEMLKTQTSGSDTKKDNFINEIDNTEINKLN